MIDFHFSIRNPFRKGWKPQTDYFCWEPRLFGHKCLTIQMSKMSGFNLFALDLDLTWRGQDHAGPRIAIEFCKFYFAIGIYDDRHWDDENNTWETYE